MRGKISKAERSLASESCWLSGSLASFFPRTNFFEPHPDSRWLVLSNQLAEHTIQMASPSVTSTVPRIQSFWHALSFLKSLILGSKLRLLHIMTIFWEINIHKPINSRYWPTIWVVQRCLNRSWNSWPFGCRRFLHIWLCRFWEAFVQL